MGLEKGASTGGLGTHERREEGTRGDENRQEKGESGWRAREKGVEDILDKIGRSKSVACDGHASQ